MPNIKVEIRKHNKNILEKAQQNNADTQLCNCSNKNQCPLNGQCLTESIIYQANITANIPGYKEKVHLGISETIFKVYKKNRLQNKIIKTIRSYLREYWKVKQQNGISRIKWKVLRKCHAYNQMKKQCILC